MAERRQRTFGMARASAAAIGVAVALGIAVYLTLDAHGNGAGDAACAASATQAQALDPLVGGEVAAFQVARAPQNLAALAFKDADGRAMSLADFSGKVTLVNLWATWCAPCRFEMPALDRLQAALGGEDFAVVPVSIDTAGPARAAEFLESIAVSNLPLLVDPSTEIFTEVKTRGLARGLPVTLLLDRNGCLLGHMNGPAEWDGVEGRQLIEAAIRGSGAAAVPQS